MRRSVTVTLDTEAASFRGDRHDETDDSLNRTTVADLLREAAEEISAGVDDGLLRDYNGAVVGSFTVSGER